MSLVQLIEKSKFILLITGIWPRKRPSYYYKLKTLLNLLTNILICLCLYMNAIHNRHNFLNLSKSLYLTITCTCSVTKVCIFIHKRQAFLKLLEMLDCPTFTKYLDTYHEEFRYSLKIFRIIWVCYKVQVYGCLLLMTIFPVLEQKTLPADFIYFNNGPLHYPFYFFEMLALTLVGTHNMALDLLVSGVFSIVTIQLGILNNKLMDTKKNVHCKRENLEEYTYQYLTECCIHYSDIEEFLKKTCIFSVIFFVQLGSSAIAICNAGMVILSVEPFSIEAVSLYLYLASLFMELGLYCWFGNNVLFKSQQVTSACYMSNWYEHGYKVRKALFLLMERTKRPMEVKGIGFVTLSLNTFIAILKWSYSYFTLLRNLTIKEE